jgi:hypothetical protein
MEKTLQVLNQMVHDGVLEQYAIGGAVAAIFYIEPINTNDLDVFFTVTSSDSDLSILSPIYAYLVNLGYEVQGEAVEIEGWPVQFLPVFNPLIEEAVQQASKTTFETTTTRVMTAEHLIAIMLQTGRLKDFARIQQFLQREIPDDEKLESILKRHELTEQWTTFRQRYL